MVIWATLVAVPTASAAIWLRIDHAKRYLARAERQSVAETPEYVTFRISSCYRLTSMRVSCALKRWFESAEYPVVECRSRVTIYVRRGYVRFGYTRRSSCGSYLHDYQRQHGS